jgi:hypothetical protein
MKRAMSESFACTATRPSRTKDDDEDDSEILKRMLAALLYEPQTW